MHEDSLHAIQNRVERAVGAHLDHPLDVRVIGRDELPGVVRTAVEAGQPAELSASYQDALTAIGLWPSGVDLLATMGAVSRDEVGGLYVPSERRLYVVRDARSGFGVASISWLFQRDLAREVPLAHEIVHALQHQLVPEQFGHDRFEAGQDDVSFGLAAAREGHATFYGVVALELPGDLPTPDAFRAAMRKDVASRKTGAFAEAPALLRTTMFLPYVEGYRLASDEHGSLLEAPPISSEQVLHPERRHEAFEAIDLGALRNLLPPQCHFVHENSAGEIGISTLLQELGAQSQASAESAAQGWAGDRYFAARCWDRREFVWLTLWDSETDAAEFEAAYRSAARAVRDRADLTASPVVQRVGREVRIASPGFAASTDRLLAWARRRRVATLDEVFAFYGEPPIAPSESPAP